jgi:hypothetical protein
MPVVTFQEADGVVAMEVESVPVVAPWVYESMKDGYFGSGYYVFNGNSVQLGPVSGTISYFFNISNTGIYQMLIRSNKNSTDGTWSNDCYTRLVDHPGYQGEHKKTFMSGSPNQWSTATKIELSHHQHVDPLYNLTSPGVYELQVSGRSKYFFIDRIVLWKEDSYSKGQVAELPESQKSVS